MDNFSQVIPNHVGIIMDGNGRWAQARHKKRSFGHKQGAKNIKEVALYLFDKGVKCLSLYAFSTENFNRPKEEVNQLFDILEKGIEEYGELALKQNIRLTVSGDLNAIPEGIRQKISFYTQKTQSIAYPILNICLNYGARQEICRAFCLMRENGIENPTESDIDKFLYTADLPELDFVIRTGGECRLSNFLLWQSAYAELYFTNCLWPDFNKEETAKALEEFSRRNRRFGKL